MRAVTQNRQLASCSGVATERVDRTTFFIGSGLAGIAGVALRATPGFTVVAAAAFVILLIGQQGLTGGTNGLTNVHTLFGYDLNDPANRRLLYVITAVVLGVVFLGTRQHWLPAPAVARCHHRFRSRVSVGHAGRVVWRDELLLGRHGEDPGDYLSGHDPRRGGEGRSASGTGRGREPRRVARPGPH